MKSYAKPVVLANDEVAEGVYAGSAILLRQGFIRDLKQDVKHM